MLFGIKAKMIEQLVQILEAHPSIEEVLIFGSRSKGNFRQGSDIDLAIKGRQLTYDDFLTLQVRIEDLNLPYKVDLIDYDKIGDPEFRSHVDRVGKTFYFRKSGVVQPHFQLS